ncbi:SRPBCC family protein [Kineosporia sp. NBRC 101731]|uniref:SRPBCC family protein n=1 Tax=Kineosporia sp. NBRC 101731 TaxID=3032199 RepID=UPI0024A5A343|nr:SRPBCC family protein [Kineosporia sp. NBRC 101731]GLY28206.1 activator of HSP90 ATPase [Kineosporia sp. NBRC 101731]
MAAMDTAVSAVRHHTFTVSRELEAPPETVYRLFSDDSLRRLWFKMPGHDAEYTFDFRVGGTERALATFAMMDGAQEQIENRSRWIDLQPGRRLLYVYETSVNHVPAWTALATIELYELPGEGGRTLLDWTEQVAFLTYRDDGEMDVRHLRGATNLRLNGVARALKQA